MIELQAIEDPQYFDVVLGEIPGAHNDTNRSCRACIHRQMLQAAVYVTLSRSLRWQTKEFLIHQGAKPREYI